MWNYLKSHRDLNNSSGKQPSHSYLACRNVSLIQTKPTRDQMLGTAAFRCIFIYVCEMVVKIESYCVRTSKASSYKKEK